MNASFVNGGVVDWILALVAAEGLLVASIRMLSGRGPELSGFFCNLVAGAFLLLALRHALVGADELKIAVCLAAAFLAHIADVFARWTRTPARHFRAPFYSYRPPRAKRHVAQSAKGDR
jgi:hypothetical protein